MLAVSAFMLMGAVASYQPTTVVAFGSTVFFPPFQAGVDQSSQINTLLTALGAAGSGTLVLPAGSAYPFGATLSVPASVTLRCAGQRATILTPIASPGFAVVSIAGNFGSVQDCSIAGGASVAGTRGADGIRVLPGVQFATVLRNEASATADNGIEDNGQYTEIARNYVHGAYTNGIYADGTTTNLAAYGNIHDNTVINNSVGTNGWDGIDLDPCHMSYSVHDNLVIGNDIIDAGAYTVGSAACGTSSYDQIQNNKSISSAANGIALAGQLTDILIEGNQVVTPTGWCIYGNTVGYVAFRIQVVANSCIGATAEGILFANFLSTTTGGYNGLQITGNHIENTGGIGGIVVKSGTATAWISGNVVIGSGLWAVDVSAAAANAGVIVDQSNVLFAGSSGVVNNVSPQTIAYGLNQTCTLSTGGTLQFTRGVLTSGTCNH